VPTTPPPEPRDPAMPAPPVRTPTRVTVRYFAGARAAVHGVSVEPAEAGSLDELTQLLADRHGERLAVVLKVASFLVDGLACHDRFAALPSNATVDVLPPFAGG
jgi:sulfur-carrier protein